MIKLIPEEITTIESWSRSGKTEQRTAFRGKIILAAGEGKQNREIAKDLHTTVTTVGKSKAFCGESTKSALHKTLSPFSDSSNSSV